MRESLLIASPVLKHYNGFSLLSCEFRQNLIDSVLLLS